LPRWPPQLPSPDYLGQVTATVNTCRQLFSFNIGRGRKSM
jgi:hypothetical protein